MSLFQRIRTPFNEMAEEDAGPPQPRAPSVGDMLRDRREGYGLDLDTAGAALRIKPIYLAALEQGRAQDLPGPTYAAGFIRAYAQYLGLDGERVLESYKAESAAVNARPDLSLPVPLDARGVPGGPILVAALVLTAGAYGAWYYMSAGERARPERVAAVPAALEQPPPPITAVPVTQQAAPAAAPNTPQLASGLTKEPTTATADQTPEPAASAPAAADSATPDDAAETTEAAVAPPADATAAAAKPTARIDIRALADCWIQVRAPDRSIVFSRVLRAGETYHVPRSGLLMRTGNAGALAIAVDGKPAPPIGPVGALRRSVALDPAALLAGTAVHG